MAFAAVDLSDGSRGRRVFSIGPLKMQMMSYSVDGTSTSGTITADGLNEITAIHIDGLVQTAAATFSGNVATIAFVAAGQETYGNILVFGV